MLLLDRVQSLWKQKRAWVFAVLSAVFLLGVVCFFAAPAWAASYVNGKYPYLSIRGEDIRFGWSKVELRNVRVNKPWVKGTLAKVTVDVRRNVWVDGGRLTVDLKLRPEGEGTSSASSVTLQEVTLDEVNVLYKEMRVDTKGFVLKPHAYFFKSGVGHIPTQQALVPEFDFKDLCMLKDLSTITVREAHTRIKVPDLVPKMEGLQPVALSGITLKPNAKHLSVEKFIVGEGTIYFEGHDAAFAQDEGVYYVEAGKLSVQHSWLAPDPKTFHRVGLKYPYQGKLLISWGSEAVGDMPVIGVNGQARQVTGDQLCSDWVRALPEPASPVFKGMAEHFKGRLSFDVKALPTPHVSFKNDCSYECSASPIKELREKRFTYETYKADGETLFTRTTGQGTADWVELEYLPENAASAFIRLEDPSFSSHKGILTASLKAALEQNMEKGYFFRGGSTITQQLAKNLWLRRHKTIGRKIEEAFLTIALESCLSKDEILETYLNVVEMGPDIYGIRAATSYYFDKIPSEINMAEAYYLAALLPNPKEALPPHQGGIEKAVRFMEKLVRLGYISEDLIPREDEIVSVSASKWQTD